MIAASGDITVKYLSMSITEIVINQATHIISTGGYGSVSVLMAMESMIVPVPSEAVMPFAGFLIFQGKFTFAGVIIASTIGSIVGSLISYVIGAYGGPYIVHRFGKYLLLREHHLTMTERFFARYGEKAVFISRFIPVVRHLISIPAGVGRMKLGKFILYTLVGAALWNTFLAYVGFQLGNNWGVVRKYGEAADLIILALIVVAIAYSILRYRRNKRPRI